MVIYSVPIQLLIKNKRIKIKKIRKHLKALSPEKILKRGFALMTKESGDSIYSVKNIKEKDKLLVQFYDGKVSAEVDSLNYDRI